MPPITHNELTRFPTMASRGPCRLLGLHGLGLGVGIIGPSGHFRSCVVFSESKAFKKAVQAGRLVYWAKEVGWECGSDLAFKK